MKNLFALLLILPLTVFSAPNSIIAIVNDSVITLDSISDQIDEKTSLERKIALIIWQIDITLQKEKIHKLGIVPKKIAINRMLNRIAKQKGVSLTELKAIPEFDEINDIVVQNLALAGLRQVVLEQAEFSATQTEIDKVLANNPKKETTTKQQHIANIKTQIIRTKQDYYYRDWVRNMRDNAYIDVFENKFK
ncbi:MAG: hypothetical protein FXV79_00575 [Candidatus Thioglobus sp.]|nr:MAG: hypothetical protein FXV80_00230 [Candidatus Thioglobus sp.]KAA0456420.1 MAG: hypothetical protein FXV79_00575 [Candidatus Thioglobus sp.]